jgi:hypothetical protein
LIVRAIAVISKFGRVRVEVIDDEGKAAAVPIVPRNTKSLNAEGKSPNSTFPDEHAAPQASVPHEHSSAERRAAPD